MRLIAALLLWLLTVAAAMATWYALALAQLAREAWAGVVLGAFFTGVLGVAAWGVSTGARDEALRRGRPAERLDLDDEGAGPPR